MPKRIDYYARGQQVYDVVRDLVTEGGLEAVTMRAVAARASLALSSLRQGYRDKDFLFRCIVHECVERFTRATFGFRPSGDPVPDVLDLLATQLPRSDDQVANARLLLALVERARATDDDIRVAIGELRGRWLDLAGGSVRHLGLPEGAHDLEALRLALLLESLINATCDPNLAVDGERAVDLLGHHVRQLVQTSDSRTDASVPSARDSATRTAFFTGST